MLPIKVEAFQAEGQRAKATSRRSVHSTFINPCTRCYPLRSRPSRPRGNAEKQYHGTARTRPLWITSPRATHRGRGLEGRGVMRESNTMAQHTLDICEFLRSVLPTQVKTLPAERQRTEVISRRGAHSTFGNSCGPCYPPRSRPSRPRANAFELHHSADRKRLCKAFP